ncbi:hypothetical protein [Mesorhizobium sp. ESP7-2]|uniref:hypothetical protein n=1 Tax=Mesorhizobium sp. ESP7-2 TaxID=2876622 RepID=UPI001CCA938D|nr:hypothetical protein [Mesorhizobium sp. ESP7-2]
MYLDVVPGQPERFAETAAERRHNQQGRVFLWKSLSAPNIGLSSDAANPRQFPGRRLQALP